MPPLAGVPSTRKHEEETEKSGEARAATRNCDHLPEGHATLAHEGNISLEMGDLRRERAEHGIDLWWAPYIVFSFQSLGAVLLSLFSVYPFLF